MELVLNVGASKKNVLIVLTHFSNYYAAALKRVFLNCMTMNLVQLFFCKWGHTTFCDVWLLLSNSFGGYNAASGVGFDDQIVVDSDLAGHAEVCGLFSQLFCFGFVAGLHVSCNNLDGAGGTKSTAPAVQNFMNMGINTEFIADSRLAKVFSRLDLNGAILSLKMNFMHGWRPRNLSFPDHTGLDTPSAIIFCWAQGQLGIAHMADRTLKRT
jgi:hypothetical protein